MANYFTSSIDNDEERVMHSKSDKTDIMVNNKADEFIRQVSDSLKNR